MKTSGVTIPGALGFLIISGLPLYRTTSVVSSRINQIKWENAFFHNAITEKAFALKLLDRIIEIHDSKET